MNVLDFIFPKYCVECRKPGKYMCGECIAKVERARLICPYCNYHSYGGLAHTHCRNKTSMAGMYAFYRYEGVIRKAILALKYKFAHDVARELVDCLDLSRFNFQNTVITPVPLHKMRQNWRGFNQSGVLAKLVAGKSQCECLENVIIKLENTTAQARLGKTERLQNIRGKFAVNKKIVDDLVVHRKKIVIFDDVWTTGATINEISKTLKKAGAKNIWGMSVARS